MRDMIINTIRFPGYMERCSGFTIPKNGVFYALYFEEALARFDILRGTAEDIENGELVVLDDLSVFELDGMRYPFVGNKGFHTLHHHEKLGTLALFNSKVTLLGSGGLTHEWQFENSSGDWEQVTFDVSRNAFLFGTPYDFDFRYVDFSGQ